jgi:murein DD-endopeptidase MepM/ murein hydrolase activator NlpD
VDGRPHSAPVLQARRIGPGGATPSHVPDWLAGHLSDELADPAALPGRSGRRLQPHPRHTEVVRLRSRGHSRGVASRLASVSFGRKGIAAALALAVVAIGVGLPLAFAASPAPSPSPSPSETEIAAVVSPSDTPDPSPSESDSPTPAPTPGGGRSAVPIPNSIFGKYTIKSGDNLIRIANSFNLSVRSLFWANSKTINNPNMIYKGQTLIIPPVDGAVATTIDGDTVQSIADANGIDPQVILDANELTSPASTMLPTGTLLILPGVPVKALPMPMSGMRPVDWLHRLTWPVPASHTITQYYGCTGYYAEPRFGKCAHWHSGVDVSGKWGTAVNAAYSGTIIYAGRLPRGADGAAGGIVVWISHGGTLYTTYNHLSGVTVKAGQKVTTGQQVGRVGESGAAQGAHLHFEVWTDYPWNGGSMADAKNPLNYIRKGT